MCVLLATTAKGTRWFVCEDKPGRPSGGTERVHRRPCGALPPDRATPESDGRRTAVPGGRPRPAGLSLCPALDPLLARPAGTPLPHLPQQSSCNKRLNTAGPLISHVIEALARQVPTWHDDLRLIDSTPLSCAASRETVKRSGLAGHFGEREVMTALLERNHHLVHSGQVILTDKGFAGREFETFLTERLSVHPVRPDRKDEPVRHGRLARVRQWIETVFDTLKGRLSLEQHCGRTPAGVFARTGQRLLVLAAGIWHNWTTGAKTKRSLIGYNHREHRTHSSTRRGRCQSPGRHGWRIGRRRRQRTKCPPTATPQIRRKADPYVRRADSMDSSEPAAEPPNRPPSPAPSRPPPYGPPATSASISNPDHEAMSTARTARRCQGGDRGRRCTLTFLVHTGEAVAALAPHAAGT
ncbi:Transposase DDE domain-containing protein [Streptomyces sp. MnatMP-M17]|nr:Transposase DDE domain-containing protein [Streptomyces sp. MnatMP-M17]